MSQEKPPKNAVSGVLAGFSHVFYTAGDKAFSAKIRDESGDVHFILFPVKHKALRRYLLEEKYLRLIGRPVTITNVSPTTILDNVPVFVARESAMLSFIKNCKMAPALAGSQIEGIVTDDSDGDCGVYTLNRRTTLVATSLCQVSESRLVVITDKHYDVVVKLCWVVRWLIQLSRSRP